MACEIPKPTNDDRGLALGPALSYRGKCPSYARSGETIIIGNKQMKLHHLYLSIAALALAVLTSPSQAAEAYWDYKTHPGNACFAQFGYQSDFLDRAPNYVVNVGFDQREGLRIVCPIVRDNAESSQIDASVTTTRGVSCSFFSMDRAGNTVGEFRENATDNMDPSGTVLKRYFSVPKSEVAWNGYFAIRCTLPPLEAVYSYMSGELAETTDWGT